MPDFLVAVAMVIPPSRPLDRYPIVRTQSIEEMRAALAQVRVGPVLTPDGRNRVLDALLNNRQLPHLGINYGTYGAAVRVEFPESDLVTQIIPITGRGEIMIGGTTVAMSPSSSPIVSSNTRMVLRVSSEYERINLSFSACALAKKLSALIGGPLIGPLTFDPVQHFVRPEAQSFHATFQFLIGELNRPEPSIPSLAMAEFEQTLMVLFLFANRNSQSHLLEREPRSAAPWQVRRAEEFIEANWDRPINVEDIAAVADVSARSLFRAFRQSRGYSPMAFAKQVRLRRANRLLSQGHPSTTVTEVAAACGFADPGQFSKDYRRSFGELPSDVLKRQKRLHANDF